MANSSFYGLTGTTATVQNTIQGSVDAAATSATNAATSETNSAASAAAALASKNSAVSSATAAALSRDSAAVSAASIVSDAAQTALDAAATAADRVQTGLDRTTTTSLAATVTANAAQVATDAAQVAADRIQTGTDAATASEAAAATSGVTAAAAQVATDAAQVAADATQVAADRVQTGLDATGLSTAVTSAQTAQAAAEAALDTFTDQYLGAKSAVPSVDNDGDALVAGALVFDTTAGAMKVWTGSAWEAAYITASGSGALLTANNLSDLASASTARVNLGLGTAATTADTDYATAAQGALADTAVQPSDNISTLNNDSGFTTFTADQSVDTTSSVSFATVNGRDVAADGTKLDGIEAGATADQTKADIDALGINATQLDGQSGSYYTGYTDSAVAALVDTAPATLDTLNELAAALGDDANFSTTVTNSIATKLPLSGGTLTGDVTFGDGNKAIFGAGKLDIQHDGADNLIRDLGTGDNYIQTNNSWRFTDVGNNETHMVINDNGAIHLYYDNATKLSTTATGCDITGGLTTTGNVGIGGAVTATSFSGDGSSLTGIPTPTLTSLGIANHDQLTVTAGGEVSATSLNVGQINNAAGTSAVTIDPSTGKPSFPNGANLPAGSVVQVVRVDPTAAWPSRFTTNSTSFVITPHVITITPKYSNSLIVIQGTFVCNSSSRDYWLYDLRRNVSGGTTTSFSDLTDGVMQGGGATGWFNSSMQYVDAPNTTSQITYEVWGKSYAGNTVRLGWASSPAAHNGVFLHAMEIAQ